MTTIVPIEDIAEILFDNSEDIPNNIYIEFMNIFTIMEILLFKNLI